MTSTINLDNNINNSFDCNRTNSCTEDQNILDLFDEDDKIFTHVKPREKAGLKGWDEKLQTPEKARYRLNRNHNIGIKLGEKVGDGYTVCFDKEHGGTLPDETTSLLEAVASASWFSVHFGTNYLLLVTEEAYELLTRYKEKVYITDEEEHDLELLTSGHALIPPSTINHAHCKKGCDKEGTSSYELRYCREKAFVDLQTMERILTPLPVEESTESDATGNSTTHTTDSDVTLPELPDDFDIEEYCSDHLPGTDTFRERLTHIIHNHDRVNELWFTQPKDRSKNELQLRAELAWRFNADSTIIQYIFEEELPPFRDNELKYHENIYHAKNVLEFDNYVSRPYYLNALSFNFREQLSELFLERETATRQEVYNSNIYNVHTGEQYDDSHIRKGLNIFRDMGLIEQTDEDEFKNKSINEKYIEKLTELNDGDNDYRPVKYSEGNYE